VYRDEANEFSSFAVNKDATTVYVSDNLGNVHVVDPRAPVRAPLPRPELTLPWWERDGRRRESGWWELRGVGV
jgi:hypothetical protein